MMPCKIGFGIIWLLLECELLKMAFVHLHQGPRVEIHLVMGSLKVCSLECDLEDILQKKALPAAWGRCSDLTRRMPSREGVR